MDTLHKMVYAGNSFDWLEYVFFWRNSWADMTWIKNSVKDTNKHSQKQSYGSWSFGILKVRGFFYELWCVWYSMNDTCSTNYLLDGLDHEYSNCQHNPKLYAKKHSKTLQTNGFNDSL